MLLLSVEVPVFSVMLRGLKQIEDINLTAIVTVADDGGSTGRIRRQFHIQQWGYTKCHVQWQKRKLSLLL